MSDAFSFLFGAFIVLIAWFISDGGKNSPYRRGYRDGYRDAAGAKEDGDGDG